MVFAAKPGAVKRSPPMAGLAAEVGLGFWVLKLELGNVLKL